MYPSYFPAYTSDIQIFYPFLGGFQDYSYIVAGCFDITLELGCCKFPPEADLEEYWNDNREALIEYLLQAQIGTSKDSERTNHLIWSLLVEGNFE